MRLLPPRGRHNVTGLLHTQLLRSASSAFTPERRENYPRRHPLLDVNSTNPIHPTQSDRSAAQTIHDAIDPANRRGIWFWSPTIYQTGGPRVRYGALTNRVAVTKARDVLQKC